jgi:hypothetical protein
MSSLTVGQSGESPVRSLFGRTRSALLARLYSRPDESFYLRHENHHYRVIQSLEFTLATGRIVVDTFDGFRKKRNISSYDAAGTVSTKEADEMF